MTNAKESTYSDRIRTDIERGRPDAWTITGLTVRRYSAVRGADFVMRGRLLEERNVEGGR